MKITKMALIIFSILLIIIVTFGCQGNQARLEADNIELVNKYWDAWNSQDIEVFKELYDHDNYFYSTILDNPNPRNYEKTIENILWNFEFFADTKVEIIDLFASDNKVTSMVILRGTYAKTIEGLRPATGQELNTSILNVMRIKNGKIIEEWEIMDLLLFAEQIGMELKPKE